jgi:hypothetical protein
MKKSWRCAEQKFEDAEHYWTVATNGLLHVIYHNLRNRLGVVSHICNPSPQEDREFETSLGFIVRLSETNKTKH